MELYTVQTRRPLAYTVRDDVISALGSGPGTCTRSLCVLAGAWLVLGFARSARISVASSHGVLPFKGWSHDVAQDKLKTAPRRRLCIMDRVARGPATCLRTCDDGRAHTAAGSTGPRRGRPSKGSTCRHSQMWHPQAATRPFARVSIPACSHRVPSAAAELLQFAEQVQCSAQ